MGRNPRRAVHPHAARSGRRPVPSWCRRRVSRHGCHRVLPDPGRARIRLRRLASPPSVVNPSPESTQGDVMDTQIDEIADRIYRFSTFVPEIGPTGFTFNQFLIDDDEPLLFHTGLRATFGLVAEAIATITPLERLRWIAFGHVEADECGAMNELLAAAPQAVVA